MFEFYDATSVGKMVNKLSEKVDDNFSVVTKELTAIKTLLEQLLKQKN